MASGSAQMSDADYFNYISAAILQAKKLDTSEEAYGRSMREFDKLFDYSCSMLRNFPRDERHLTRDDIRKTLAEIRDNLVLVWKSYYKKNTLETIDKLLAAPFFYSQPPADYKILMAADSTTSSNIAQVLVTIWVLYCAIISRKTL